MRIVGGDWRRTPLRVGVREGLRPTSERVRETVFDWLGHLLGGMAGVRVLDLFAGSGALGLEAASRGAASVDAVETDRACAAAIRETVAKVRAEDRVRVTVGDAFGFLERAAAGSFDLVFIDPPFARDLQEKAIGAIRGALAPEGLVYVESPEAPVPEETLGKLGFVRVREGRAGQVAFELLAREGSHMSTLAKLPKVKGKAQALKNKEAQA